MGYIDPNTGGMLFQVLAAGLTALSGFVLVFSRQIRTAFARFKRFLRERSQREETEEQRPAQ